MATRTIGQPTTSVGEGLAPPVGFCTTYGDSNRSYHSVGWGLAPAVLLFLYRFSRREEQAPPLRVQYIFRRHLLYQNASVLHGQSRTPVPTVGKTYLTAVWFIKSCSCPTGRRGRRPLPIEEQISSPFGGSKFLRTLTGGASPSPTTR